MLENYKVILASNSPRRRELLGMLDIPFEIAESRDIEETYPADLDPEKVPEFLSRLKAEAYSDSITPDNILITADTVVICGNEILGKPASGEDAVDMLMKLSGRSHKVVTGVCVTSAGYQESFSTVTIVEFDSLRADEIEYYVSHYSPLDKAGAYGIQEWIGAVGVKGIDGSFYNVMGLPVNRLYNVLRKFDNVARPVTDNR